MMKTACLVLLLGTSLIAQSAPLSHSASPQTPAPVEVVMASSTELSPVMPGPAVEFFPHNFNFGKQKVGTTVSRTVSMTNTGNAILLISAFDLLGEEQSKLTLSSNCGSSLAEGVSCSLTVSWLVSTGKLDGYAVQIVDNAGNQPQILPIMGFGVGGD